MPNIRVTLENMEENKTVDIKNQCKLLMDDEGDFSCYNCGKMSDHYCKYTDLFYCDKCAY